MRSFRMIVKAFILLVLGCYFITCPPVKKPETSPAPEEIPGFGVEYDRYLQEVFKELETDPEFKKRAENLNKTEDIAQQLDFVHHSVRTKLDELKRREIDRLNAAERLLEAKRAGKDIDASGSVLPSGGVFKMDREHLDAENPHTFEIHDLERLVKKVTKDLASVDQQQEKEYKRYEMEKEHLRKKKLDKIKDPKLREETVKKMEESKKRHEKHPSMHEPGSEDQLKEVWEKEDHLDKDNFDPNTFFHLHDQNGDGHLDIKEMEALMQNELNKAYDPENPDDDENEKFHEMMRMRQEIFKHVDVDSNDMISKDEFLAWTNRREYKADNGWKTAEELDKKSYDETEFRNFEEQYDREHPDDDDRKKSKTGGPQPTNEHSTSGVPAAGRKAEEKNGSSNHAVTSEHHEQAPDAHQDGAGNAALKFDPSAADHKKDAPVVHNAPSAV